MNESLVAVSNTFEQATSRASVLMPALVEAPFDYLVPKGTPEGALVEAKLAGRSLVGAVWSPDKTAKEIPLTKLKSVIRVIDTLPPLKKEFRQWLDWISDFTLAPKGAVLSLCGLAHAAQSPKKNQAPQQFTIALPTLTEAQQTIADALGKDPKPTLLDGVTGSGKTEVYFHAIADVIARAQTLKEAMRSEGGQPQSGVRDDTPLNQVLVLLPEIALTHQWLERFERTFGASPVVWHSRMTPAAKARAWQAIARGEVQVVVGARSALFLPFAKLGLIVVDEEHDPSYKQEDGVLYHARDMAVVRAHFERIPIVLVSATPSLETIENVREGKYRALHLPERFGAAGLPSVKLIDMRIDQPERGQFLSPTAKKAMLETLARNEQVLFFLNRRGYAPLLLCRGCGHRFQCSDCSAWLTVHGRTRLECHHCGHKEPLPKYCPECQAPQEKLAPCGPGVERIAEEVRGMFVSGNLGTSSGVPSPSGGRLGWGLDTADSLLLDAHRKGHPLEKTLTHARDVRTHMTKAEKKLWQKLRGETLNAKFRRQHPIGNYITDFVSLDPKLVIEIDGGQHNTLEAIAYDKARTEFLQAQGFTVLRFWNNEVIENIEGVVVKIAEAIGKTNLHPNPPPEGEETPPFAPQFSAPSLITLSSDESITPETWGEIEAGEIDILVGTQMVAKGHHFPRLTLVVVVDADVGLDGADLRAGERTYQLLHQLGGRAGRGELAGTVLVQTYIPDHPVMKALVAHDRDRLMTLEAKERRAGGWPPFGQLAAILLDGKDEAAVRAAGQMLARTAPDDARLRVLGPAPAPLSKLRGQYRYRLLIKAQSGIHLQRTLRTWLAGQHFKGVRIKIDVNPYYFM